MREHAERRKYKRFQAPDRAFAIHGPYFINRSQVIDISTGGLAFRCIGRKEWLSVPVPFELDILFAEGSFYLGKLPVKTTSDKKTDQRPFDFKGLRHGVQFGKLTQGQTSQVEYFIQNHTTGVA